MGPRPIKTREATPRLNADIYNRILEFAVEETPRGCDHHVPQETLVACMLVSKVSLWLYCFPATYGTDRQSFNILTGPVLYRRVSVIDIAALLKGLRIPQYTTGEGSKLSDMAKANRPKDRPPKLKLLGYIERIDVPRMAPGLSREYTTADTHDPERIAAAVERWNQRVITRWEQGIKMLELIRQRESDNVDCVGVDHTRIFARLQQVWVGGLSQLLPWRDYPAPSALWKYRAMLATRIQADWIPYDSPARLGRVSIADGAHLLPLLASVANLETICSTTAYRALSYPQTPTSGSVPALKLNKYGRPRTSILHLTGNINAWVNHHHGSRYPLLPGIRNVFYHLVDTFVDQTRALPYPLPHRYSEQLAHVLGQALGSTIETWLEWGLKDLLAETSVDIYGLLGDRDQEEEEETGRAGEGDATEATAEGDDAGLDQRQEGGSPLAGPAEGLDAEQPPSYRRTVDALQAAESLLADRLNRHGEIKKSGFANRIHLWPAKASMAEACPLCGLGCWD